MRRETKKKKSPSKVEQSKFEWHWITYFLKINLHYYFFFHFNKIRNVSCIMKKKSIEFKCKIRTEYKPYQFSKIKLKTNVLITASICSRKKLPSLELPCIEPRLRENSAMVFLFSNFRWWSEARKSPGWLYESASSEERWRRTRPFLYSRIDDRKFMSASSLSESDVLHKLIMVGMR